MRQILTRFGLLGAVGWATVCGTAQTTIDPAHAQAWCANAGWVNWRGDGAHGARVGEYVCSGYLYAANLGWINLGNGSPAQGVYYQNNSATDFGVNRDPLGTLSGFAYGANTGWLSFTNRGVGVTPSVDLRTGRFSGYAYSANVGWISLSNAVVHVRTDSIPAGADADGDGMTDAWELGYVNNLTVMNADSDTDEDGFKDVAEYRADTDPLRGEDLLRIAAFELLPGGGVFSVTWSTKPTRDYFLQSRTGFDALEPWLDAGHGVIQPEAGSSTTEFLLDPGLEAYFLRVEAVRPLAE